MRHHRGFSLLELMIAVVIVAVLAAVAYPAYTSYVGRGYRAEAHTALDRLARAILHGSAPVRQQFGGVRRIRQPCAHGRGALPNRYGQQHCGFHPHRNGPGRTSQSGLRLPDDDLVG